MIYNTDGFGSGRQRRRLRWRGGPACGPGKEERQTQMILITGGLGFIGSHTTRALLDLGESCVLAQRHAAQLPVLISGGKGGRVVVEQVDVTNLDALRPIGQR
jgi:NADP-dependent 3-hydroxy acid dehydrogenase YdfG